MFKRVIWFGIGSAAGAVGAVWAEQKVKAQLSRARPSALVGSASSAVGAAGRTVRSAFDEGRQAMQSREDELRARLEPPGRSGAFRPAGVPGRGRT